MNQIPNIEETHNTREVEEFSKKWHELGIPNGYLVHMREYHHQQLQKALQDWLREEIVRLEGMKQELLNKPYSLAESFAQETRKATNQTLQTIIDRYQAELDQDNK